MAQDHEYSVLGGLNRAAIGRYLSVIAAGISSLVLALALSLVDLARWLGWQAHIPPLILLPITGGAIYAALYFLFKNYVWKLPSLARLLRVPDLAGAWSCEGMTLHSGVGDHAGPWQAEVVIVQDWDVIRLRLKTAHSISNSIAAALRYDRADGYSLLYNYANEPRIGEPPDLRSHRGCADLVFAPDLQSATGEYFNGHGRYTFGTMKLARKSSPP